MQPDTFFGNNAIRIVNGVVKISNNDEANYSQIADDGEVTLVGTGRIKNHIRVCAPSWTVGGTAPTPDFVGITPVWLFDKLTDDDVHYSIIVPWRMAAGNTMAVVVDWCHTNEGDNGTVCWNLDYLSLATGESLVAAPASINKTTPGTHTFNTLVRTTLDTGITGIVAGDVLALRLWRDTSEDTLNTDACLVQVHFEFLRNKLGLAT